MQHRFYNIKPDWRYYQVGFISNDVSAKYFDEIGLEVIPLTYPLEKHGLKTYLYLQEEEDCHAYWCTGISGCIQRGISLVGTEAILTLLLNCSEDNRLITIPISHHGPPLRSIAQGLFWPERPFLNELRGLGVLLAGIQNVQARPNNTIPKDAEMIGASQI